MKNSSSAQKLQEHINRAMHYFTREEVEDINNKKLLIVTHDWLRNDIKEAVKNCLAPKQSTNIKLTTTKYWGEPTHDFIKHDHVLCYDTPIVDENKAFDQACVLFDKTERRKEFIENLPQEELHRAMHLIRPISALASSRRNKMVMSIGLYTKAWPDLCSPPRLLSINLHDKGWYFFMGGY